MKEQMQKYLPYTALLAIPGLCAAMLNMYAPIIPFAAEGTLLIIACSAVAIAYLFTAPQYKSIARTQPLHAAIYAGMIASIVIFCAAQLIRLIGGFLYAATFVSDSNAFAYQMHYVLPNFWGGITQSFTAVVGISFALGICIALPLIIMCNRTKNQKST